MANRNIQGIGIEGKVLDVKLNHVKIHLDIDEKQDVDIAHWFPYSAEANNVWYTMPHIGERVKVQFPTMIEAEALTMCSNRGNSGEIATVSTMNKPTEKYMDTKWGKQVALHEGDIDINIALMSMVLDEKNITIESNQNIVIEAKDELNLGRSEFISYDKDNNKIVKIEETKNITIETEELATLSVINTGTTIELEENNLIIPLGKVRMVGYEQKGYPSIVSEGQTAGEQAEQDLEDAELLAQYEKDAIAQDKAQEDRALELDARKKKGKDKKYKGSLMKVLGGVAAYVALGCVAVACVAAAPAAVVVGLVGLAIIGVGVAVTGHGS